MLDPVEPVELDLLELLLLVLDLLVLLLLVLDLLVLLLLVLDLLVLDALQVHDFLHVRDWCWTCCWLKFNTHMPTKYGTLLQLQGSSSGRSNQSRCFPLPMSDTALERCLKTYINLSYIFVIFFMYIT
ncbi:uncharacterized protein LOC144618637 isoform X2 [Crassostrea virginica]